MSAYGYTYQETTADATATEADATCESNVRQSLLWDRWRSEHAPTAEQLRARAVAAQAERNGSAA